MCTNLFSDLLNTEIISCNIKNKTRYLISAPSLHNKTHFKVYTGLLSRYTLSRMQNKNNYSLIAGDKIFSDRVIKIDTYM